MKRPNKNIGGGESSIENLLSWYEYADHLEALVADLAAMLEKHKHVEQAIPEWNGSSYFSLCPECRQEDKEPHTDDCALAALLKRAGKQ